MSDQTKCTCADESGYLTCPAHPPINGITPNKFDILLRCLPKSPYRDRFTAEIITLQDQLSEVTRQLDDALAKLETAAQHAAYCERKMDEVTRRHCDTVDKLSAVSLQYDEANNRIKASQEQEPAAHMYPSDLEKFREMETVATAFSVAVGCPSETSVSLFAAPIIPPTEAELLEKLDSSTKLIQQIAGIAFERMNVSQTTLGLVHLIEQLFKGADAREAELRAEIARLNAQLLKRDEERDSLANMQDIQIEKLQAQVAMLREAGERAALHWSDAQSGFQSTELLNFRELLEQTESDRFVQQVRDEAYERAAQVCDDLMLCDVGTVMRAIRNLKGTK